MAKLIINGDHLTSAEWDVLGKETGRLRYESLCGSAKGFLPSRELARVVGIYFSSWPEKPRIFREYEGGEIEITKDVWK